MAICTMATVSMEICTMGSLINNEKFDDDVITGQKQHLVYYKNKISWAIETIDSKTLD